MKPTLASRGTISRTDIETTLHHLETKTNETLLNSVNTFDLSKTLLFRPHYPGRLQPVSTLIVTPLSDVTYA